MELHYTDWQDALRIAWAVIIGAGIGGVLVGLRWHWRPRNTRQRRQGIPLALISAASLVAGVGGQLLTRHITAAPPTFVDTPTHFRSAGRAFELEAPPGWRLQYDSQIGQLMAISGAGAPGDAPVALVVTSSPLSEDLSLDRQIDFYRKEMEAQGLAFEPLRAETFAGAPARSAIARKGVVGIWIVFAERSRRHGLSIQCVARDGADPRQACAAPLGKLTWLGAADARLPATR